jgi:hypothetical protein
MPEDQSQVTQEDSVANRQTLSAVLFRLKNLLKSKTYWRLVLIFSGIAILVLFVFGIAVHLIVLGILLSLIRISAVYRPFRRFISAIAGLSEGEFLFPVVTGGFWKILLIVWPVIMYLGLFGYGAWLILRDGFLSQNLIYLLFLK